MIKKRTINKEFGVRDLLGLDLPINIPVVVGNKKHSKTYHIENPHMIEAIATILENQKDIDEIRIFYKEKKE